MSNDKAKVIQALNDSFAHFRNAIMAINDADLDKARLLHHDHGSYGEHLGLSIAYARMNGIVPPWTEEAQQQQQKQAQKPNP